MAGPARLGMKEGCLLTGEDNSPRWEPYKRWSRASKVHSTRWLRVSMVWAAEGVQG